MRFLHHCTSIVGTADAFPKPCRSLIAMTAPAAAPMLLAKQPIRAELCSMKVERGVPGDRKFSTNVRVKTPAGGNSPDINAASVVV